MTGILDKLKSLSAAEDFFGTLDLPYDPAVLNVSRLHILKRFNQYMAKAEVELMPEEQRLSACREALSSAYTDFLTSNGVTEKMFKVFKDQQAATGFVSLDTLKSKR